MIRRKLLLRKKLVVDVSFGVVCYNEKIRRYRKSNIPYLIREKLLLWKKLVVDVSFGVVCYYEKIRR